MWEWLDQAFHPDVIIPGDILAIRLGAALVLGFGVALVYCLTQRGQRAFNAPFFTTLVLLSILIAAVTQVIGSNSARAFSLVGALAIIRFRTVVEDTRDTGFVIFAVVVGMAVGAGYLLIALICIGFIAIAMLALRPLSSPARESGELLLTLRVGLGGDPEALWRDIFAKHLLRCQLRAMATARQGAALDVTYAIQLRDDLAALALIRDLNRCEGMQNAELRQV